jgi:hypothetical protein
MSIGTGVSTIFFIMIAVILLAVSLGFAVPIGISASHRGMNPIGWAILAFFTWIAGLVLFLLHLQPVISEMQCPVCGNLIPIQHVFCPFCGHRD